MQSLDIYPTKDRIIADKLKGLLNFSGRQAKKCSIRIDVFFTGCCSFFPCHDIVGFR